MTDFLPIEELRDKYDRICWRYSRIGIDPGYFHVDVVDECMGLINYILTNRSKIKNIFEGNVNLESNDALFKDTYLLLCKSAATIKIPLYLTLIEQRLYDIVDRHHIGLDLGDLVKKLQIEDKFPDYKDEDVDAEDFSAVYFSEDKRDRPVKEKPVEVEDKPKDETRNNGEYNPGRSKRIGSNDFSNRRGIENGQMIARIYQMLGEAIIASRGDISCGNVQELFETYSIERKKLKKLGKEVTKYNCSLDYIRDFFFKPDSGISFGDNDEDLEYRAPSKRDLKDNQEDGEDDGDVALSRRDTSVKKANGRTKKSRTLETGIVLESNTRANSGIGVIV